MESVNYEYFDSENDYSKNPNATKHRSLEWKSKFYILIYLDFMRDLILFSEIYNLIFLVYNAFIRHKQHSFLHDKRTSGNSVQD